MITHLFEMAIQRIYTPTSPITSQQEAKEQLIQIFRKPPTAFNNNDYNIIRAIINKYPELIDEDIPLSEIYSFGYNDKKDTTTPMRIIARVTKDLFGKPQFRKLLKTAINLSNDLDVPLSPNNYTLLMLFTEYWRDDFVDLLINNNVNLDNQTTYGMTALHFAVKYNNPKILEMLLQAGANPLLKTTDGRTPLDYAKDLNHTECIDVLKNYTAI